MYTTRPLSTFRGSHGERRSEEPFSGSLFLDDQSEFNILSSSCCWAKNVKEPLKNLPFPQDRIITIKYSPRGEKNIKRANKATVFFVPVLNQPSSASFNRYHVIIAKGRNKGKVYVCSKEGIGACCSCRGEGDVKPRPFDHRDVHQQMEIVCEKEGLFTAKSVAHDGQPPWLLGSKYWKAYASKPKNCHLSEALGLRQPLRSCLPDLNFPIHARDCPKVTIGKWYCPFVFVKEAGGLDVQMKRALYYEMTLEQFWKEIYTCENNSGEERTVEVNALVESKAVFVDGKEVGQDNKRRRDGFIWFAPFESKPKGVGLSLAIRERMIWEQKKGGWIGDDEDEEVERIVREFGGENNMWRRFACYILVERYVLKRVDGSLALTFDFRHLIKFRTKWE
ncbi:uncharacterized protein LOC109725526 [Ananas comosus]|uniref:Uncharacterized protein LOC109725526 n=1 Tax=Ananas comosus TaxID=4615 RepID=A0A6P5GWZ2_ANACO|nr:uncharacterized protein LOC109725526 [Ananas comosus]